MLSGLTPRRGEDGIVGVNLVLVIAFALFAVIVLTRTLLAAQNINHNVAVAIHPEVGGINSNLNTLPVLDQVNSTAAQILTAAKPLSGQAGQIVDATQSIMGTVHSINGVAKSINADVRSIGSDVSTVGASVGSISAAVGSISGNVGGIASEVGSIHSNVGSISGDAGSINSSVHNILGNLGGVLTTAQAIKGAQTAGDTTGAAGNGIAGINNRADAVIGVVGTGQSGTIKGATAAIKAAAPLINVNAHAICKSNVFQGNLVGLVPALQLLGLALGTVLGITPAACP